MNVFEDRNDGERGLHDSPPSWGGENVAKRWKKYKRELLLWRGDTKPAPRRQGLKVWRRLTGKAADLAEVILDTVIQDDDGVWRVSEINAGNVGGIFRLEELGITGVTDRFVGWLHRFVDAHGRPVRQ